MSRSGLFQLIKRALGHEPRLHPVDRQMAKHWIKQRLIAVYPELRNSPAALEQAYQALSLEARPGTNPNGPETVFEVKLPGPEPEP
ncbi:MAG: hypothetical protein EOP84_20575 [Verrucomicrobiaceae bacterium]|nr:MAG: hypothetical protein EOP84_20575 [Verrucomicrobiaceae bacterium]